MKDSHMLLICEQVRNFLKKGGMLNLPNMRQTSQMITQKTTNTASSQAKYLPSKRYSQLLLKP